MDLFKAAKAKGSKASPKPEKETVLINEPRFHLNLSRLAELNVKINELEAEKTVIVGEVKERCIEEFVKLYKATKTFPGSFVIRATPRSAKLSSASLMFITTDNYLKIGKERHEELQALYGTSVSVETTTYEMDAALVEKWGSTISDLISKCKTIPEEDKAQLIKAQTSWSIAKGIVKEIPTKWPKHDIGMVIEDLKPVYQMKNVKLDS